jgi:MarR family transcriptional regulator, organic hydroperoxide resistance regulator
MPSANSRFTGPDDSPGFLLWRVASEWQRRQREALEPLGLTHVQFVLLAGIGWQTRNGERVTQAELARHTHTDEMMTSQVVRVLADRELVIRVPHPADQRAKALTLTPTGRKLLEAAVPVVEATDVAFFDSAGRDRATMLTGFRKLLRSGTSDD